MTYQGIFVVIFSIAVTGGGATLTFYDYGGDHLYAANVSQISSHIKQFGYYKFTPSDFVNGSYDILYGPVFISFAPSDHVEQHAYYIPRGISSIGKFDPFEGVVDAKFEAGLEYNALYKYLSSAIQSKYGNGFTPKAAEIAAPEFYFYNLTKWFSTENDVGGFVPFVFVAPQHERPETYYIERNFRKFAEFSVYQPLKQPVFGGLAALLQQQHPGGFAPSVIHHDTAPILSAVFSN